MNFRWRRRGGCAKSGCGCLISLSILALTLTVFAIVFNAIKHSDPYQSALVQAQKNEQVIQALGEPIKPGWWITGQSQTSGSVGFADFAFPISGPQNSGTLHVEAKKSGGVWELERLELEVEGQSSRIPLLTGR